jgi:hypothetical protein
MYFYIHHVGTQNLTAIGGMTKCQSNRVAHETGFNVAPSTVGGFRRNNKAGLVKAGYTVPVSPTFEVEVPLMAILDLKKITEIFFKAPEIMAKLGQRADSGPLDCSFEKTTYLNIFGDGAALLSDKNGTVNIMASFRNPLFCRLLLGEEEYAEQLELKGEAAGWQHQAVVHNIAWGNVDDDGMHNKELAQHCMAFAMELSSKGFYFDSETGLTFVIRVSLSNDLKAMSTWYLRGGASHSANQHSVFNEIHL